jgi:hypothetical protein
VIELACPGFAELNNENLAHGFAALGIGSRLWRRVNERLDFLAEMM